ncbi:hypothetical protein EN866_35160 [Mesorhizobium sp. M2D.F.Ca.ET.223.01.1.1]|uniref:hypothetical protein n=1 Tax=Mesorhizobium sp. M2D.F.Ca.ET.223.01.1.1 TaxID=2563940 RepID=UPI0010926C69|nr:hypothetical protein [Mesorhizobium sp. M2D.F.Ca.ET.223.01.1.1]TGR81833.1 hypothetical protein EN866_35160 [Mesorhizobium sp. M2D.F.Ca.ET.223.01.1.1]TGT64473.1 hypothetical protein EN802_32310 [bacterium M00.F.Ca.ET.159.01.1.1]TGT79318.1 hypothetical protein EN800_31650 [bacterium M00.F.Ca.ET.157.01.1.1]
MEHLLVEPAIVPDIFCTGLADAEDLGDGNFRFTLYARQKSLHDLGNVDYVVVARLVMPAKAVMESMKMTMKAMSISGWEKVLAH